MLTFQTLSTIEALLLSKSDPRWGEFMILGQAIAEVQAEKTALANAQRAQVAMTQQAQQMAGQAIQQQPLSPIAYQNGQQAAGISSGQLLGNTQAQEYNNAINTTGYIQPLGKVSGPVEPATPRGYKEVG